ncbi:MAG: trigger factor [Capsulimonadaceae bacterium]|nr:trigger factor [Capsulimonadaceae bacterium]
MQVVKETLSPCQVSLQISVEPDKVAQAVDKAYREFSKFVAVPGFRKGHAPMAFVKPRVPQEQLRERTAEILVEPAYSEAIEQENVAPYAAPKLELLSLETHEPELKFEFKAIVPLPPQVELGAYSGLAVDRERYAITDETIDARLKQIQDSAAEYPVVTDRPSQIGDILVTDLTITPEGESEPGEPRHTVINLGDPENVPGLDEQLLGLSKGDEKAFRLKYPDDFTNAEVAGQEAGFFVKVEELHSKVVPALDDEFASKFGGVPTLDELKRDIRTQLEKQMTDLSESLVHTRLVDQIIETSTVNFPDVLLEREVESQVHELLHDLEHRKVSFEDYLERAGKTQEALLDEFKESSDKRLRRGLALAEIARKESIQVVDADIEAEIADRATRNRTQPEAMRAYLDANNQMESLARSLLTKKILEFVTSSAIITDKVLDANEPAETDAPKAAEAAPEAPAEKPKRTRKKKED